VSTALEGAEASSPPSSAAVSAGPSRRVIALLVVLAVVAVAVRVPGLGAFPDEFHPTRQYRAALITRRMVATVSPGTLDVSADRARAYQTDLLEPPITELLASVSTIVTGGEHLWLDRLIGVLFWVAAGAFVAALAARLTSWSGAVVSAALFWFLPYTVYASRSFQPEPLFLCLMAAALWATVRYDEREGRRSLLVAGALGGAAVLVKPVAVFQVGLTYLVLLARRRRWQTWRAGALYAYGAMLVVPAVVWSGLGIVVFGFLRGQAERSFFPSLYLRSGYWTGWLARAQDVIGPLGLVAIVAGLVLARGRCRAVLAAMTAGYLVFGLIFNYHIATHDYYSEQLLLVVALAAAVIVTRAARVVSDRSTRRLVVVVAGVFLALLVVDDVSRAADPIPAAADAQVESLRAATSSAARAVYLSPYYGSELAYRLNLPGTSYPYAADIALDTLAGVPSRTTEERLDQLIAADDPDVFVIASTDETGDDPELRAVLDRRYPVRASGPDWVVYDLRRPR
jgi:4-amino-4-deoxy-L-arabinose transferase-like glycosyltransferase